MEQNELSFRLSNLPQIIENSCLVKTICGIFWTNKGKIGIMPLIIEFIDLQMSEWFNIRKAAQVAAFFARSEGGNINVLKLVKLIYLSDRLFMEKYDRTMLNDQLVSMDNGPVNSITLDLINGFRTNSENWDEFIKDRDHNQVGVTREFSDEDLKELSVAELSILKEIWKRHGRMTGFELADWTHENCFEWDDPDGSSTPIHYKTVFKFLGKEDAQELGEKVKFERYLDKLFAGV